MAVACSAGIAGNNYDDDASLASEIKGLPSGERILVVGHSNTLGPIATALGVNQTITIDDDAFDNLIFVGLTAARPQRAQFKFDFPQRPQQQNPEGYPIGFSGEESIELTCAACHTSRLTVAGKEY